MKTLSLLKFFSIFFIAVFSWLYFSSCSCNCSSEEVEVPPEILKKANDFIIAKTGIDFFNKYITPDLYHTTVDSNYYNMVYRFHMPEKPFVDGAIKFSVDKSGKVEKKRDIVGIPDCKEDSRNCQFLVDEEAAIKIAEEDGLEKGIKDWKTGLIWDPKYDKYVWHILSTLKEIPGEAYKASGKELIINPYSGEIIARNEWNVR